MLLVLHGSHAFKQGSKLNGICRGMLAERLLGKSDFDTDNEIRTLEHLKKRFGEANLHDCEVSIASPSSTAQNYIAKEISWTALVKCWLTQIHSMKEVNGIR